MKVWNGRKFADLELPELSQIKQQRLELRQKESYKDGAASLSAM